MNFKTILNKFTINKEKPNIIQNIPQNEDFFKIEKKNIAKKLFKLENKQNATSDFGISATSKSFYEQLILEKLSTDAYNTSGKFLYVMSGVIYLLGITLFFTATILFSMYNMTNLLLENIKFILTGWYIGISLGMIFMLLMYKTDRISKEKRPVIILITAIIFLLLNFGVFFKVSVDAYVENKKNDYLIEKIVKIAQSQAYSEVINNEEFTEEKYGKNYNIGQSVIKYYLQFQEERNKIEEEFQKNSIGDILNFSENFKSTIFKEKLNKIENFRFTIHEFELNLKNMKDFYRNSIQNSQFSKSEKEKCISEFDKTSDYIQNKLIEYYTNEKNILNAVEDIIVFLDSKQNNFIVKGVTIKFNNPQDYFEYGKRLAKFQEYTKNQKDWFEKSKTYKLK